MTLFARCFLLVFCQLGVGGLLALAVPPFHDIERGFYKSSAGVFFTSTLVGAGGSIYLRLTRAESGISTGEALLWAAFVVLFALYLATLWGDPVRARARFFVLSLLSGFAGLAAAALSLSSGEGALLALLAIASSFASAAALGAVTCGMLIGHWYLVDPGLEIEPFRRCFRFFVGALCAEVLVVAAVLIAVALGAGGDTASTAASAHWRLAALRFVVGPVAALGIAALIQRVLAIPQTMAATGLFYIATLSVLVGGFLGHYFTFRTGLPL